ncbi:MAG: hypothetical protein WC969_14000 [Elusimicrobiota bacterium]|jgi:hypothetical protein
MSILIAAALLSACMEGFPPPRSGGLRSMARVAVTPFSDREGLGRLYADETLRGLWALGFDPVSRESLDASLRRLGFTEGETMGPQDLASLREATRAEAVLFASVDCGRRGAGGRVSFSLQSTADGSTLLSSSFVPSRCGSAGDVPEVAARVLAGLRRLSPAPEAP